MPQWTDLFLHMPLSEGWLHGLLFVAFGLHLLFVLLMLGTALLSLLFFMRDKLDDAAAPQHWNEKMAHSHMGLKSLAVVLGVAPLLIMQVSHSHVFFTVTGLFSYAWLAVIPLLIFAFLLIDAFAHNMNTHARTALVCGLFGVAALLTVPAIFTSALALMERQEAWAGFAAGGFSLNSALMPHWILRYLHVVGAALAMGAAFHLFFTAANKPEKSRRLQKWLLGALAAQAVLGVSLLLTVLPGLSMPFMAVISLGAAALLLLLWNMRGPTDAMNGGQRMLLILLPVIFVSMLFARQLLQNAAMDPVNAQSVAQRQERAKELAPFSQKAREAFALKLKTVYDNGETIYDGACQPCHGSAGRADGPEAARLHIPAADLAAIKADRDYIYAIVRDGTPGSGMPYFRLYDREKLESLLNTMGKRFAMFTPTPPPPHDISPVSLGVWIETCAVCHSGNGGVSDFGRTLRPAPPDFRRFTLSHERALHIITEGYPGTAMQPFRQLPENVRDDLAVISNNFRINPDAE